ncbi:MAG: NAD(P)/FAD-dependent oxidoreductase [Microthrixaceae bacterium]|nr:NAD(P)/FAD-dependent oxidoreductase [Microthrixaceae bacterium]MCO5320188.1 NAD(P)/FAD-dependent oxidoreductase [Microthrixaceae bacterium]
MTSVPKVLILGAGFAGLGAARKLAKAPVDVVLVDRHDYHTFQPLLYQVATDILDPETVGHPVREYVDNQPNLRFVTAKVSGIDIAARNVTFEDWEDQTYDYLVVGLGARANFFGTPGADEHAFPLYTLNHAIRLKNHVLEQFEAAVKAPPPEAPEMMDVVIVGGGPTGVETAGAMADLLYVTMARDAPRYPIGNASITLVEHGDRLLRMFNESMSEYTKEALEERGVTVRLGESVAQIDQGSVTLGSGEVINAPTTVWGAGLTTSPLAASLSDDLQHGRVPVGPLLNLAEHPEVYVAGDLAWAKDARSGEVLPQLGSVALQAGEHIGRTIDRTLRKHKDPEPFHYIDKGSMATIGRGAAVGVIPPGLHLTGRPAFLTWGAVHLALLNGADSKTAALTNWFWTWMRHDRPSRVLIHPDEED